MLSVSDVSDKKLSSLHPWKCKTRLSAPGSSNEASQPVILQSIQLHIMHMNDLLNWTSEGPDAAVQSLAVDNFWRLETNLDSDQHAFFFDLFSINPSDTKMYNQLRDTKEDHCVYNHRKATQARQSPLPIKVSRYPAVILVVVMLHWLIVFLTIQFTAAYASIQGETTLLLQAVVAN